jgi:hypothetical protein
MMHGHEKSDSVIVAVKPANKVAQPAAEQSAAELAVAELVEPRAETKGNACQRNTCRAQHRISVPQALERIRKVARERKKERFTTLLHQQSCAIVEFKRRNPRIGCPRIAQKIARAFGIDIDKDIVPRVLAKHYRPEVGPDGPSWLSFIGHMKDSLWSVDLFRCESILLRSHWVMVVKDVFRHGDQPL